jgi:hypothetical protein
MKKILSYMVALVSVAMISGCGGSSIANVGSLESAPAPVDGSKYVLAEEPDGAVGVIAARESASDGDPIVVVGRIGGATNPWIDGRAAFMLLDASMTVVADGADCVEGQICLDDCCAQERAGSTTLVKVVDASGRVLAADARQLLGVAADDMVVVRGNVSKDENGNFVVLADGVHIRE